MHSIFECDFDIYIATPLKKHLHLYRNKSIFSFNTILVFAHYTLLKKNYIFIKINFFYHLNITKT